MAKLSDHEVDPAKLDQGVWWEYERHATCPGNVPKPGVGCFKIRPFVGNDAFHAARDEATAKHAGTLRDKATAEAIKEALRKSAFAEAVVGNVLVDWSGWEDLGPFERAKALALFTERRWRAVSEFIVTAANAIDAVLLREEEQAKGN